MNLLHLESMFGEGLGGSSEHHIDLKKHWIPEADKADGTLGCTG